MTKVQHTTMQLKCKKLSKVVEGDALYTTQQMFNRVDIKDQFFERL